MQKLLLLLFTLCLHFIPTKAQYVTIPDANFVAWLTQNFPSCMLGNTMDTTCNEIITEDSVIVTGLSISGITGVEYFDNLSYLKCNGNLIDSLPRLPSTLIYLNCNDNQLTNLPTLPLSLEVLECRNNQITYLPQLPSALSRLICNINQLSYLPSLPNALTYLDCSYNQLTSLPPLPNNLITLYTGNNQLSSITAVPSSLRVFSVGLNPISIIPPLPNELLILDCDSILITNLPNPLPDSLVAMHCGANQLTSLPTLPNNLLILGCQHNLLSSLPAIPPSLSQLFCSYNNLASIPLVPNQMYAFYIDHNDISCLVNLPQVSGNTAYIANNLFTCVPNQTSYSTSFPLCLANDFINNPQNCPSVANLTGKIFLDLDLNCNLSVNDSLAEHVPVKLYDSQNNFIAQSYTINGMYSFAALQAGSYKIEINENDLQVYMACGQSNSILVNLDSANQTLSNLDFGLLCEGALDIKVQSITTHGVVFPGQTHKLITNIINNESYYNLICDTILTGGIVTISVSGPFTYQNPANGALIPSVNANTFTYNISNFNNLNSNSFALNLLVDTTAQLSDQICVHVAIIPTPIDAITNNNTLDFCYHVLNSYDPNIKEVYPVDILPGFEDWLTYSIHFQNTGNAAAINIGLKVTLDPKLNINTFEMIGSSHPANVSIYDDILTVRFNNIMLLDSTTDYEGSIGYFQYRIKPKPNQQLGTQIKNTAYIYFDYNAPIITNTTQNNFITGVFENSISTKNEFILYPNPSNGLFNFKETKNLKQVEVYNLLGEQILAQGNQKQINLSGFAKGIYYARINGEVVVKLVKD